MISEFVEVKLADPEDFLKVRETLTRIGIASKKNNTLYQSCHILHKKGKYYIVHFKSLFELDGKKSTLTEDDRKRTNTIINLLEEWNLVKVPDEQRVKMKEVVPANSIMVIKYAEKSKWNLVPKYSIGVKK